MTIATQLAKVRERIDQAARANGRDPASVRLVAVSKTKPAEMIREAWAAGQRDFGENYVQELLAKHEALADLDGIVWHAIGHVQTNKARDVARVAHVVHTVDSLKLGTELSRRAAEAGRTLDVLIQVNVGAEVQKAGCDPQELSPMLVGLRELPALRIRGLMTVPPHTEHPLEARPYFERLARLRDDHGLTELSIGMTHDLEVAVACGATYVRIGSAIFGER